MLELLCDNSYKEDLTSYTERVLKKSGISSQTAERETMYLSDRGNTVALKFYADLIFYKKILRRRPYREAFALYLRSAGLSTGKKGEWISSPLSYPLSFWKVGYYLINYKKGSVLANCERIDILEDLSRTHRLETALSLSVACLEHEDTPEAVNLTGRILKEISYDQELFDGLKSSLNELSGHEQFKSITGGSELKDKEDCDAAAEQFFIKSAQMGYVYACNNLAAAEAEKLTARGIDEKAQRESLMRYIEYLKSSADRYEPYAANRLGLFYLNGIVKGSTDEAVFREYVDFSLAKEYFIKATKYPDENSAWAFFNLIRYFHRDYDNNIELLNEHMDYIKELNPKVYDIAIEL